MTTIVAEDEGYVMNEVAPNAGLKIIHVRSDDALIGGTDDLTIDLSKWGCTNVHGVHVFDETTTGSVTVLVAATTSVSSRVLTIDLGGGDTGVKSIIIYAY